MNVRIHHPLRNSLTVSLGLSGLALAAGCGVAPAGATANSPAIGPVRTGNAAKNFPPFPVPTLWNGKGEVAYRTVVEAKTGTAPRRFGVTARLSMVFWLNCIGTGTAHLTSPAINLKWGVPCGNGADPAGLTFSPVPATHGQPVKVLVTASAGARWEVRIDEPAPAAKTT
ncbi:MAG: hypothetical protein ACRDOI_03015 [Trebonia sp.]